MNEDDTGRDYLREYRWKSVIWKEDECCVQCGVSIKKMPVLVQMINWFTRGWEVGVILCMQCADNTGMNLLGRAVDEI